MRATPTRLRRCRSVKKIAKKPSARMEDRSRKDADQYMVTRSMAISSVFLPRAIERQTYINILRGLFGDIAKEPVMTSLGFDISMRLMRPILRLRRRVMTPPPNLSTNLLPAAKARTERGPILTFCLTWVMGSVAANLGVLVGSTLTHGNQSRGDEDIARKEAQKETRRAIAEFVDYLLRDPMYNVKAIPDNIERLLYINCFELIVDALSTVLSDFELDMLGRRIRMEVQKAPPRSVKSLTRFRPDANALNELTREFEQMRAVREIMTNERRHRLLAFVAQLLSDFEVTVVGRRLNTALSRRDDAVLIDPVNTPATDALNETLLKVIESFAQGVFAAFSSRGTNVGGSVETRTRAEIDFDKEAFALFESNASKPDDKFPFPYLNPEQFADDHRHIYRHNCARRYKLGLSQRNSSKNYEPPI